MMDVQQFEHIKESQGEYFIRDTRITVENVADSLSVDSTTPVELSEGWDVPVESIHEAKELHEEIQDQRIRD